MASSAVPTRRLANRATRWASSPWVARGPPSVSPGPSPPGSIGRPLRPTSRTTRCRVVMLFPSLPDRPSRRSLDAGWAG
eukprot:4694853-Pleurochrysis_carterae.AAC.1